MKLPSKSLERNLFKSGYRLIYAVDEVGMGCLAGPVVVCAVAFKKKFFNHRHKKLSRLRDSKLLSAEQRKTFADQLLLLNIGCLTTGLKFKIAYCYPKTIDKLNVYQASRQAMRSAIKKLEDGWRDWGPQRSGNLLSTSGVRSDRTPSSKAIVLIDGKTKINGLKMEQVSIIKGDRKVFAIACASIIAKVYRDKMMARYAKKYPGYGFEKHKGYGTTYHQVKLSSLGPCEIHRKSFRLTY